MDIIQDFKKIKEYAEELLYTEDTDRIKIFINVVQDEINKIGRSNTDKLEINKLKTIIRRLKWICLQYLSEKEILEMTGNYFTDTYNINEYYDIWEHLEKKLLTELNLDKRNNFKLNIRNVLKNSNEILIKSGKIKTIGGFIKNYSSRVGEDIVFELEQQNFFQSDPNLIQLSEDDKAKVKKLINFYERLKISSKSLMGIEDEIFLPEEDYPFGSIKRGEIITPIKNDKLKILEQILGERARTTNNREEKSNIEELRQLAAKYPARSLERKVIEEEVERLTHNK